MLTIKFFQVRDTHYAKARSDGYVIDTTDMPNVFMKIETYLKTILTWGWARNEIEFIIDPTCGEYEAEEIMRAISIYINEE